MLTHLTHPQATPRRMSDEDDFNAAYEEFLRFDAAFEGTLNDLEYLETKSEVNGSLYARLVHGSRESLVGVSTIYPYTRLTPKQFRDTLEAAQEGIVDLGRRFISYLLGLVGKAWKFISEKIGAMFKRTTDAAKDVADVTGNPSLAAATEDDAPKTDAEVKADVPPLEVAKEMLVQAKSEILIGTAFGGVINVVMAEKGKRGATKEMIDEYFKNATAASKDVQRRVLKGTSLALPEKSKAPAAALQDLKKKAVNLRSAGYTRPELGSMFQRIRSILNPANFTKSVQSLKTGIMGLGRVIARQGVGSLGIVRYTGMCMWRLFKTIWWYGGINKAMAVFTIVWVAVRSYKSVKARHGGGGPEETSTPSTNMSSPAEQPA